MAGSLTEAMGKKPNNVREGKAFSTFTNVAKEIEFRPMFEQAQSEQKQRQQRFKSTLNSMLLSRTGQYQDQLKNLLGA